MKMQNVLPSLVITILILASLAFSAMPTYAQNPPPPEDPNQSWNPPEEGGEPFMLPKVESKTSASYYPPPRPGTLPSIQNAYFIDESGQRQTQFGEESFYLVVQVNTPGYFYLAEYYPLESGLLPHWLIYRCFLNVAGTWTFGPFYPISGEPVGRHTWKMWLYASGAWAQRVAYLTYQPSYPYPPYPYPYPTPTPITAPTPGGWGSIQVLVVTALVGALGITVGMLISGRHRYATKTK
jgi:hypothetical protein